MITEDLHAELAQAAESTGIALTTVRNVAAQEDISLDGGLSYSFEDALAEKLGKQRDGALRTMERDETQLCAKVSVMQPILRFLQLLCENHNRDLQVSWF